MKHIKMIRPVIPRGPADLKSHGGSLGRLSLSYALNHYYIKSLSMYILLKFIFLI